MVLVVAPEDEVCKRRCNPPALGPMWRPRSPACPSLLTSPGPNVILVRQAHVMQLLQKAWEDAGLGTDGPRALGRLETWGGVGDGEQVSKQVTK
mgnify:CR=1 FL=1